MRRLLFLVFFLCFGALVLPCSAIDVQPPAIPVDGDVWDGETITAPSKLVRKDGVPYYEISTCAELAYILQTGGSWVSANYILTNDLILNDVSLDNMEFGWDEEDERPLTDTSGLHLWAHPGYDFSGFFDGDGHTISGLYSCQEDYAGLFGYVSGTIQSLHVVNAYVLGHDFCGGITGDLEGDGSCINCLFSGRVTGNSRVGGIAGCAGYRSTVTDCVNFASVSGNRFVGGIAGEGDSYSLSNCANYGSVSGTQHTGGIVGCGACDGCSNLGAVTGASSVGGITGWVKSNASITHCYNAAPVTGTTDYIGGIAGMLSGDKTVSMTDCYNTGNILCDGSGNHVGAIIATNTVIWGKDTVTGCYYLKNDTVNPGLFGCCGVDVPELEPSGTCAKSEAAMKTQSTYAGWDFTNTWRIDPERNGGYPYLAWEDASDLPYEEEDPYQIGPLTVRNTAGNPLSAIPSGPFLVTVPLTRQTTDSDALVLVAAYTADGKYQSLMYVAIRNATKGATVEVTLPVENAAKDIVSLKAFAVPSFQDMTPMSPAGAFPAE